MKLLEVKNNLVKISYEPEERVALGRFITINGQDRSYIAQIINMKADISSYNAIGKLLFVFGSDGIVDSYDGTLPPIQSELSLLSSQDILSLMPVENPVKLGILAQQNMFINVDKTFFEGNLTICAEKYENISDIVYAFVTELSNYNDKTVVIDTDNNFGEYESLKFRKDFRLPLNSAMIDFLIENELKDVDSASKAVVEEIFSEVREYAKTVDFIPFDTFISIIAQQYDATNIPELALLKNKLKKYNEENVFAQVREEFEALQNFVALKRIAFISISDIAEELQNEVISFIYSSVEALSGNFYLFAKLNNKNSNKKLLRQIFNTKNIFTSIICNHAYTYLSELKQFADDLIFFAPQTVQHDFASYNVFLNKLNPGEFIVCGSHTYNVPFIVDLNAGDIKEEPKVIEEPVNSVEPADSVEPAVSVVNPFSQPVDDNPAPAEEEYLQPDDMLDEPVADINSLAPQNEISSSNGFVPEKAEEEPSDEELLSEEEDKVTDISDIEGMNNIVQESIQEEANVISEDNFPETEMNIETDDVVSEDTLSKDELVEQVAKDVDEIFISNKTQEIPPIENLLAEDDAEADNGELTEADLDFLDELPAQGDVSLSQDDIQIVEEAESPDAAPVQDEMPAEEDSLPDPAELDFSAEDMSGVNESLDEALPQDFAASAEDELVQDSMPEEELPVYPTEEPKSQSLFEQGDMVSHPKYGRGVIEKLIKYGNKTLCSVSFDDVGRRLLDPSISELQKV